jgi:hypothetical protein
MSAILQKAKAVISQKSTTKRPEKSIPRTSIPVVIDEESLDSDEIELRAYLNSLQQNRPQKPVAKTNVGDLETDDSETSRRTQQTPPANPYLKSNPNYEQAMDIIKGGDSFTRTLDTLKRGMSQPISVPKSSINTESSSAPKEHVSIVSGKHTYLKSPDPNPSIANLVSSPVPTSIPTVPIALPVVPTVPSSSISHPIAHDIKSPGITTAIQKLNEIETDSSIGSDFSDFVGYSKQPEEEEVHSDSSVGTPRRSVVYDQRSLSERRRVSDILSKGILKDKPEFGKIKSLDEIVDDSEDIPEQLDPTSEYYSVSEQFESYSGDSKFESLSEHSVSSNQQHQNYSDESFYEESISQHSLDSHTEKSRLRQEHSTQEVPDRSMTPKPTPSAPILIEKEKEASPQLERKAVESGPVREQLKSEQDRVNHDSVPLQPNNTLPGNMPYPAWNQSQPYPPYPFVVYPMQSPLQTYCEQCHSSKRKESNVQDRESNHD